MIAHYKRKQMLPQQLVCWMSNFVQKLNCLYVDDYRNQ